MSATLLTYAIRVGIVASAILIIMSFPWPDIEPYLGAIDVAVGTLFFFSPFVPIELLFFFVSTVIIIELSLLAYRVLITIINFIASGTWHFGPQHPDRGVGSSGIGGPGVGDSRSRFTPGL